MPKITPAVRMDKKERRKQLLDAGVKAAELAHYSSVTCKNVAEIAGCSGPLVTMHLGPVKKMRDAIMVEAIRAQNLKVVAQGLAAKHARCMKLDKDFQARAIATLTPQ